MKLIVGLGNPGKEYENTRHNAGFMFVDAIAKELGLTFALNKQLKCFIADKNINGEKVIFCKPVTYMNLSGESVSLVLKYFKLDVEDMLVIHDDLDLPVGKVRLRGNGSSGGQKGMQNIIDIIKVTNIKRIRIGIAKGTNTINHVLGAFNKEERIEIDLLLAKAYEMFDYYLNNTFDKFMSRYN